MVMTMVWGSPKDFLFFIRNILEMYAEMISLTLDSSVEETSQFPTDEDFLPHDFSTIST